MSFSDIAGYLITEMDNSIANFTTSDGRLLSIVITGMSWDDARGILRKELIVAPSCGEYETHEVLDGLFFAKAMTVLADSSLDDDACIAFLAAIRPESYVLVEPGYDSI